MSSKEEEGGQAVRNLRVLIAAQHTPAERMTEGRHGDRQVSDSIPQGSQPAPAPSSTTAPGSRPSMRSAPDRPPQVVGGNRSSGVDEP